MVGQLYHLGRGQPARAGAGAPRLLRPLRRRRPPRPHVLGRDAPPPRPRRRAGCPAAGALPRRADDRPRHPQPHRALGRDRGARLGGDDGAAHHAVPRRGRPARRSHRRDRPGPGDRGRDARRAEEPGRRRAARDPSLRRAAWGRGRCRSGLDRQRSPVPRGRIRPRPGRRAPGDDCRRRPSAGRRRHRDRRHLRQHPDAGRRLPETDRARGRARRARKRRPRLGEGASLRDLRHARAREAQPAADPAPAGPARRLHGSADPVRPALRLRLRRGDQARPASTTSTS